MSEPTSREFVLVEGEDARRDPVRLVVIQGEERPPVHAADEPLVMTFPHLLLREAIAFLALSVGLVVLALVADAPLEEIANPEKTPNPAKAPWYFLGLQELLHYYPPVISGVLLPGLVVLALAVIPYFDINLVRPDLWHGPREAVRRRVAWFYGAVAVLTVVFFFTGAHPVYPILGPLWFVAVAAGLPLVAPGSRWIGRWLGRRSLAFFVFLWFLLCAVTLTLIGVFFRGPGWSFTLPWRDGVY